VPTISFVIILFLDRSLSEGVNIVDRGKGELGLELARRISSDIGKLLRLGATSYRAYSGVVPSALMLEVRLLGGLTADRASFGAGAGVGTAFSYTRRHKIMPE